MKTFTQAFSTLLMFSVLSAVTGCSKKETEAKDLTYATRDLSRSVTDVYLPRSLWQKIEALGIESVGGLEDRDGTVTAFVPVQVYLTEKNEGILKTGDTKVIFGPGGGELDLADFVEPKKGTFRLRFEFAPELGGVDRKVFFLSNSKRMKLGQEILGTGCNTYFDISSFANKSLLADGEWINTSYARHVSLLAGTYFFAALKEGKLHIASLVVRDSANRQLQCARKDVNAGHP